MLIWIGARNVNATIDIWLDDQAKGVIKLFRAGKPAVLLAQGVDRLSYQLVNPADLEQLVIEISAQRPGATSIPLFMRVAQNGTTLEASEEGVPANGVNPPYGDANLAPPLKNNTTGKRRALLVLQ